MPMNFAVCGAAEILALEVKDPVVSILILAMPLPIITWTASSLQATPTKNTPLVATGAAIAGEGGFTAGSSSALTTALCSALGIVDPVGMQKMGIVTAHYASVMATHGRIVPASLVGYVGPAPPPTGPVTGTGKVVLAQPFKFYEALGITDAPGIKTWKAFGDTLQTHIELLALVTPAAMLNPAAGGPVTGTGTVS